MDIGNGQHISAFYNFFLFIECLFADGKHKTAAMLEKLASNDELCKAITTSSSEYLAIAAFKNSEIHKKLESNASPKDIIEYLIDRRGFLHHHSLKNKSIWHPERQGEWEPHARFSQFVAHKIAFARIGKKFFTQEIEKEYLEMSTNSGASIALIVEFTHISTDGKADKGVLKMTIPGTKATHRASEYVSKQFFEWFDINFGNKSSLTEFSAKTIDGDIISTFRNYVQPLTSQK